ncbi:MAG: DUF4440 domain-containing protein [bacterium]
MIIRAAVAVVVCLLCCVGCDSNGGPGGNVRELVRAERRFARDAASEGVRTAFLKYLAQDAIVFRPYPVNGREWFLAQPETEALLSWEPVVADVSVAGDLGYTTGPWSFSAEGVGVEPNVFGEYASVWRRPPRGEWRVVVDVGTTHDRPAGEPGALYVPGWDRRREGWEAVNAKTALDGLMRAESEFAEASRTDRAGAYRRFAAEDIRYCPADDFPLSGRDAVVTAVEVRGNPNEYKPSAGDVSRSGDLGYVYGCGSAVGSTRASFCYLRVWRCGRDARWKIVLDVSEPVPLDESADGQ